MIRRLTHVAVVLWTAASIVVAPVCGQAQEQAPSAGQPPSQAQPQQAAPAVAQVTDQARSLHLSQEPDYSHGRAIFPNFLSPYRRVKIPEPMLTNSPRIEQLIHEGKLMLSLDDAISLALENNLDIRVQRFTPWIAQTDLLRAKAGGVARGLGSSQAVVLGAGPSVSFDPIFTSNLNWSRASFPVNNPFLSGTGVVLTAITNYSANANFGYSQGFHTGTAVSVAFDNARTSTTSPAQIFNPAVQSTMIFTVSQPLLNGFGTLPNTRFIMEAKNTLKVADWQFALQVITSISQVQNQYWELVYARLNVKVQQAAVATSTKLYEDNKKQLQIGTMAPLDVLTAESQLATDTQNLIVAQANELQQETLLLQLITKNILDPALAHVELVPTTDIAIPDITAESIPLEDAVKEAWQKRPELQQSALNLKNAGIEVKATRNALLPTLNLFGQYSATGLSGNSTVITRTPTAFLANANAPIVNSTGTPIPNSFEPIVTSVTTASATTPNGLGNALQNMINNNFPTYAAGLNLTLPIRNRSAQADSARALIDERQLETQYRQLENSIVVDVRNAQIAVQQGRAQVDAAVKARQLAQETYDDEVKKYQLGTSTSYNVVLRQRDLTTAEGTEIRAEANLVEAVVTFNRVMGRTLEVNQITLADAKTGRIYRAPNIPGTPDPAVYIGYQ